MFNSEININMQLISETFMEINKRTQKEPKSLKRNKNIVLWFFKVL